MNVPILSRTLLYRRLPRGGGYELLDWCIVNTTLGAMVEPRTIMRNGGDIKNTDVFDAAFTDIQLVDDAALASLGFAGTQWPRVYNTQ